MGPGSSDGEPHNGGGASADDGRRTTQNNAENPEYLRGTSVAGASHSGSKHDQSYREKQVKVVSFFLLVLVLVSCCLLM
jgi:hypothetical protein